MVRLINYNYLYMVADSKQGVVLFASLDSEKAFMRMNEHKRNGNADAHMVSAPLNVDIYKVIS